MKTKQKSKSKPAARTASKSPAPKPKSAPARKRKTKTDTTAGAIATAQAALAGVIKPPAHVTMRPTDMPFWNDIIRARAREMWTDIDLVMAANLARCLADVEKLQGELDKEGPTVKNQKGTSIANPKFAAITQLTDRMMRLMRLLHVHPAATAGRSADEGNAMRAEREAEETLANDGLSPEDADLLPSPDLLH